jgi:hypothetical protein
MLFEQKSGRKFRADSGACLGPVKSRAAATTGCRQGFSITLP